MRYQVICSDGKDRVRANHKTYEEARFDAGYLSHTFGCLTWADEAAEREHGRCPGGQHFVDGGIVFVGPDE